MMETRGFMISKFAGPLALIWRRFGFAGEHFSRVVNAHFGRLGGVEPSEFQRLAVDGREFAAEYFAGEDDDGVFDPVIVRVGDAIVMAAEDAEDLGQIGRASCRERV